MGRRVDLEIRIDSTVKRLAEEVGGKVGTEGNSQLAIDALKQDGVRGFSRNVTFTPPFTVSLRPDPAISNSSIPPFTLCTMKSPFEFSALMCPPFTVFSSRAASAGTFTWKSKVTLITRASVIVNAAIAAAKGSIHVEPDDIALLTHFEFHVAPCFLHLAGIIRPPVFAHSHLDFVTVIGNHVDGPVNLINDEFPAATAKVSEVFLCRISFNDFSLTDAQAHQGAAMVNINFTRIVFSNILDKR